MCVNQCTCWHWWRGPVSARRTRNIDDSLSKNCFALVRSINNYFKHNIWPQTSILGIVIQVLLTHSYPGHYESCPFIMFYLTYLGTTTWWWAVLIVLFNYLKQETLIENVQFVFFWFAHPSNFWEIQMHDDVLTEQVRIDYIELKEIIEQIRSHSVWYLLIHSIEYIYDSTYC